jgi:hypothetical protein
MGNPHATFFVDDCEAYDLAQHGHGLEHAKFFPERCNVSVVTVAADKSYIRMRVGRDLTPPRNPRYLRFPKIAFGWDPTP